MKHYKLYLWGLVGFVIFALLFFAGAGVAIYRFSSEAAVVKGASRLIPYPAARVNWHFVRCSDYFFDLDTLNHFYKGQQAKAGTPTPNMSKIKQNVLERLIKNYFMEKIAKDNNISINSEEIAIEYGKISQENNGEENLIKLLKDYYNWTPDVFKKRVIYYSLLDTKLIEALGGEDKLDGEIDKRTGEATIKKYLR